MKTLIAKLLAYATIFLVCSCTSFKSNITYTKIEDVFFSEDIKKKRLIGDFYRPNLSSKVSPLIILVHGGGWSSRHKGDMDHIAESLASHGFAVFNINYRLAPEFKHPAPVDDLKEAVSFMKNNAEKYNIDPLKIGLWGYSSGGHTVSMYALENSDQVQAVVSGGAPYDLTWWTHSPYVFKYLGAYRDDLLDEYFNASPFYKIHKDAPAFFLYHAKSDKLVDYEQMTMFDARLRKAKVDVQRHGVSFLGHANTFLFSKESIKLGVRFLESKLK